MPVARCMIGEPHTYHDNKAHLLKILKKERKKAMLLRMKVKFEEVVDEEMKKIPAKIITLRES
jgi:hypothetical protein